MHVDAPIAEIPRGAAREYITREGFAAVYLAVIDDRCVVGASQDLQQSQSALQKRSPSLRVVRAWWVKDRATADGIARAVKKAFDRDDQDRLAADATHVQAAIEAAARAQRVALTAHASVMKKVKAVTALEKRAVSAATLTGDMKPFNQAYAAYRVRHGKGAMSYNVARARLARVLKLQGEGGGCDVTGAIAEVFGDGASGEAPN
ncbi:hypothetical protein [Bradyrhizobium sp. STM 3562]|uniref:hypothetical protein n=1 Tax=Bradyrhizobium sp. STM 3562 TaxID=578924 RepID=UPI003890D3CC